MLSGGCLVCPREGLALAFGTLKMLATVAASILSQSFVAVCAMTLAPKTASAPNTMPILFDRAILRGNMLPSRNASSLELARGILSERLADRLGLTQLEAVHT